MKFFCVKLFYGVNAEFISCWIPCCPQWEPIFRMAKGTMWGKNFWARNIYFCSGCGSGAILSNLCGQNCKRLIPHLPPVSWRSLHVTQHCRLIPQLLLQAQASASCPCHWFAPLPMHCHGPIWLLLLSVGAIQECQNWLESKMKTTFSIWSFLLEWLPLSKRIWKQAGHLYESFFGINWLIIEFLI